MAAGSTYTPIATTTLGSAQAVVTFNSIASTYTDLVLICNTGASSAGQDFRMNFNNDSTTIYSGTILRSGPNSARYTNNSYMYLDWTGVSGSVQAAYIININNYSNSTTYKTAIIRANDASNFVEANVGLWRSTAAINRIDLQMTSGNLLSGSTFTLWGILNA